MDNHTPWYQNGYHISTTLTEMGRHSTRRTSYIRYKNTNVEHNRNAIAPNAMIIPPPLQIISPPHLDPDHTSLIYIYYTGTTLRPAQHPQRDQPLPNPVRSITSARHAAPSGSLSSHCSREPEPRSSISCTRRRSRVSGSSRAWYAASTSSAAGDPRWCCFLLQIWSIASCGL
jgi:hypothetical protein